MSQDTLARLRCDKCKSLNYWTTKNPKSVERKLELKKYCAKCRVRTKHAESKKKSKK